MFDFLKSFLAPAAAPVAPPIQPAPARRASTASANPRPSSKGTSTRQPSRPVTPQPVQRAPGILCPDMMALVAFDHQARVVSPFAGTFDPAFAAATQTLPSLVERGQTNMAAGLALANRLLAAQPAGLLRRIWLLTDGHPNPPDQPIWEEVEKARQQRTNINTVGFGNPEAYDAALLGRIAAATHNGRFAAAGDLAGLNAAFRGPSGPRRPGSHRGEATVFVIDVSGSMANPMGQQRAIDVVASAMIELIRYKQRRWS